MKIYILIVALLVTAYTYTLAQEEAKTRIVAKSEIVKNNNSQDGLGRKKDRFKRSGKREPLLQKLSQELELTIEQKDKIAELVKAERDNFRKEDMAKRSESHKKIIELIKSDVLTPEQSAKLDEMLAKRENGEFADERKNKHLNRLSEDLQLTEDQRVKLDELISKQREERKARREEARRNSREMFQENKEEFREELSEILTSEQLKKFDELNKNRFKDRKGKRFPNDK